ncbi:competence protein ComGC [Compostibacillus humi]|uniref:ComG operon protein 3 n=1 Tax=Compostibacillus humi TaxID=1245525 RepID=A0A8J2TKQ6_9BACI|nr:competence type IV pilus major pilin ComGC [Compostibacillus humi]GFZ77641.1 competence protein ComGC [Compostibacillus humi]HLT56990.1 competence type IV pilus major pilin ComGC [Bacillota bacterium]
MNKKKNGFTLIEMLIVLLVISVLMILIIPNLAKRSNDITDKGCDALIALVEAQVNAYYIENREYPADITKLIPDYIKEDQTTCPNGDKLTISGNEVRVES